MARRRPTRDWTVEEYEAWAEQSRRHKQVAKVTDESGGPRLSLVPAVDQDIAWPTDLLAPQVQETAAGEAAIEATPFDGIPLEDSRKRLAGWCAERQRLFLTTLAETGSVHLASDAARLSARSAYALRARSPAFARAWDTAQILSVGRLSAIAFDRAINGRVEPIVVSPGVTWSSTYSGSLYGWTGAYSPSNLVIGAGPNTPLIGLNIGYTDASPQPPAYATMTLRFDAPISGILAEIFWADGTSGGNSANIAIYNSAGTLLDYTPFNNNGGSIGLSSGYYGFFRPQGDIAYINFNNGFIGARNITLLGNPAVGAVPEPSTSAMMLTGFGAIGFAVRRSRPRRAVAALPPRAACEPPVIPGGPYAQCADITDNKNSRGYVPAAKRPHEVS